MRKRRVTVFIDGLNMRNRLRECGWPEFADIQYLAERLVGNRNLVTCYYCVGRPNSKQTGEKRYWAEVSYYRRVEQQPQVQVQYGYMVKRGKWVEKKVDVLIATKMVEGACTDKYDTAVLVSADGDLVPAVETVVAVGKHVEVVVFTHSNAYIGHLVKVSTIQRNARRSHFRPF